MSIFDLALIIIILGFVINGLFKGIIKMTGSIVALFLGIFFASRLYLTFYSFISSYISGQENVLKIISFIVILLLSAKIIELLFNIIEKIFKLAAFIPGSRFLNNILGAVFGLFLGSLLLGIIIHFLGHYLDLSGSVSNLINNSKIVPLLLSVNKISIVFLPESLKSVIF